MVLILQIVLLVIGVGGAIVSALALDNPTWRVRSVIGFATLGATGFVLIPAFGRADSWLSGLRCDSFLPG